MSTFTAACWCRHIHNHKQHSFLLLIIIILLLFFFVEKRACRNEVTNYTKTSKHVKTRHSEVSEGKTESCRQRGEEVNH